MLNIHEHPSSILVVSKKGSYLILVLGGKHHPRDWSFWGGWRFTFSHVEGSLFEKNSSARVVAWRTSSDCKKNMQAKLNQVNHQNRMTTQQNNPNLRFNAEVRCSKSNIFSLEQLWFRFFFVCVVGWWRAHQGNSKVSSGMCLDTSYITDLAIWLNLFSTTVGRNPAPVDRYSLSHVLQGVFYIPGGAGFFPSCLHWSPKIQPFMDLYSYHTLASYV